MISNDPPHRPLRGQLERQLVVTPSPRCPRAIVIGEDPSNWRGVDPLMKGGWGVLAVVLVSIPQRGGE